MSSSTVPAATTAEASVAGWNWIFTGRPAASSFAIDRRNAVGWRKDRYKAKVCETEAEIRFRPAGLPRTSTKRLASTTPSKSKAGKITFSNKGYVAGVFFNAERRGGD